MSGAPAERQAPAFPFPPDEADPVWDEMVRRPLARMAELAKQMGATLVVVVIPTDRQVRDAATGYPTTPQSVVQRYGRERGVRIVPVG